MKAVMPIKSVGDSERVVYGYVMVADVVDAHNDRYNPDEMKKAAELFLVNYPDGWVSLNTNHGTYQNIGRLVQSTVIEEDGKWKWYIGIKIMNEAVWQSILKNGCTGFSIEAVTTERKGPDGIFDQYDIVVTGIALLIPDPEHNIKSEPANPEAVVTLIKSAEGQTNREEKEMTEQEIKTLAETSAKSSVDEKLPELRTELQKIVTDTIEAAKASLVEMIEGVKKSIPSVPAVPDETVLLAKSTEQINIMVKDLETRLGEQFQAMIDKAAKSHAIPEGGGGKKLNGSDAYLKHVEKQLGTKV